MKLQAYGFKITRAQAGGYLLTENDGTPLYTFKSTGAMTAGDLANKTGAPREIIERELALLVSEKSNVEENEEDEEILVKYKPSIKAPLFLAEQVWDGRSAPKYIVHHFECDQFESLSEISLGETDNRGREIIYRPVYNNHLIKGMVTVPKEPVKCIFEGVIDEAFEYVGNTEFYDPCGKEDHLRLNALIVMGSWFLDRMVPKTSVPIAGVGRFAPIIPIRGPSETGKNRHANLLRFLSYRPYFDLSKTRIPSLFRPLDIWKGVLIMDEGDFQKTGATSELIHFLNARATGTPISRQNPDKVSESQVFESFGLTILTQRQHFDDNATESRCVPFYSEKTMKKIPTIELDDVVEKGLELQDKLLYLRLTYWPKFEIDKREWFPGLSDHRLNASLLPTMSMSQFEPNITEILKNTISTVENTKRKIKANSMDGQIVNLLWEKIEQGLYEIWNQQHYVLDNKKPVLDNDGEIIDEQPIALTTSKIKESLGIGYKTARKILNSLNIASEDAPPRIRAGSRTVRPVFFIPYRLEKQLREFVVGYEPWKLYNELHLKNPDSMTLVPDVTRNYGCATSRDDIEDVCEKASLTQQHLSQVEHVSEDEFAKQLIKEIRENGQVGLLWPRAWLEDRGVERKDADYLVEKLKQEGRITQQPSGGWIA